MKKVLLFGMLFLIVLELAAGLNVSSGPTIAPSRPKTTQTLDCSFTVTGLGELNVSVSWFNNSVSHEADNETRDNVTNGSSTSTTATGDIESGDTESGEVWVCSIQLKNETNTTDWINSSSVTINTPPTLIKPNVTQWPVEDLLFNLTANATDAEGDTITNWLAVDQNASDFGGSLFTITSGGLIEFTANSTSVGNHTISILAYDGLEYGGSDIYFVVNATNDAPVFVSAMTFNCTSGSECTHTLNATDEENNFPFTYSNSTLFNVTNTSNTSALINFTPTFGQRGQYWITMWVNDSLNGNRSGVLGINITANNNNPVLQFVPQQNGTQNSAFTVSLNGSDLDAENDSLTFNTSSNCSIANPWQVTTPNSSGSNASGLINFTLNNSHVVCRYVNITLWDNVTGVDNQTVFMNITNVNDAPEIFENSTYGTNTYNNTNSSYLVVPSSVNFTHTLNYTDVDNLTYEGENLTFSDNDSYINVSQAGVIQFFADTTGDHSVLVTLTDDDSISFNRTVFVNIVGNSVPQFSHTITNQTATEDVQFLFDLNATDGDGDSMSFSSNASNATLQNFSINSATGVISFTPNQSQVGTYEIRVTVNDSKGASNYSDFNLTVLNGNDGPTLTTIVLPLFIEEHGVIYDINATDPDSGDTLTFAVNDTSVFTVNATNGLINTTLNASVDGTYAFNFTVTDGNGSVDSQAVNLTVFNRTARPNISVIRPFGQNASTVTVDDSLNTTNFTMNNTLVNLSENTSMLFNLTVSDDNTSNSLLTVDWYVNGTFNRSRNGTDPSNNISFGFFSAGLYDILARVNDTTYENSTWIWTVNVSNRNRDPVLSNSLRNVSLNGTTTFSEYFVERNALQMFFDADDDADGNGTIDPSETLNLTIISNDCALASFVTTNNDLKVVPTSTGNCSVIFNASDEEGRNVSSNNVTIVVSGLGATTSTTKTISSSTTTDISRNRLIPFKQDVDVPKALRLVFPDTLEGYGNDSIRVLILLENTWTSALQGITIGATANDSDVDISFSEDNFERIEVDDVVQTTMTVSNFNNIGPYKITINASVIEPVFDDSGSILLTVISPPTDEGEALTKIAFARELLNDHPECQELNELLDRAEDEVKAKNYDEALKYTNAVVSGCKHLVSIAIKDSEEAPQLLQIGLFSFKRMSNIILLLILLSFPIGGTVYIIKKELDHKKGE